MNTKVYIANTSVLADKAVYGRLYIKAPEHRKIKTDRMRFDNDKRLSIGAGALLSKALKDLDVDESRLNLTQAANGKPYFISRPDIQFNISHSEERVMCCISCKETGCDVEKVKEVNFEIAKRFFTPDEYKKIMSQPDISSKEDMFFRLWTLKESYIKATGHGLAASLNSFSFDFDADGNILAQSGIPSEYSFFEFNINDGYKYACCLKSTDTTQAPTVQIIDLLSL